MAQAETAALADRQRAVKDLSPREYLQWRHHPISKVILHFLEDRRHSLEQDLARRFLTGSPQSVLDPSIQAQALEARGRILESADLEALEWRDVAAYYGVETPELEQESE